MNMVRTSSLYDKCENSEHPFTDKNYWFLLKKSAWVLYYNSVQPRDAKISVQNIHANERAKAFFIKNNLQQNVFFKKRDFLVSNLPLGEGS